MKKSLHTSILCCGDFFAKDTKDIRFATAFEQLISATDLRVINFEAPIKGNNSIQKSGPALYQLAEASEWLEEKGFNVISLANNHIMDYACDGLFNTLNSFHKAATVGVGNKEEAYSCKVIESNGIKIGFISLTHYEFGILEDDKKYGAAWINHPCVNNIIIQAKQEVNFLIILSHAGVEEIDIPLPEWRQRYKEFIDYGADAVIASHPHTPQGWEIYKEKPIFYSLGNCIFQMDSDYAYWNKGLAVRLDIEKDRFSFEIYPITYTDKQLSIDKSDATERHLNYLNKILNDESAYYEMVDSEVVKLWKERYYPYFVQGLGAYMYSAKPKDLLILLYRTIFKKSVVSDYATLLNNVRCETHRWCIQRAIKLIAAIEY